MPARKSVEVANQLRKNILSGVYGSEGGLPDFKQLSETYHVAINTIVAALAKLEGEGIIVRRGNSYYVHGMTFTMTHYVPPIHARKSNYAKNLDAVEWKNIPQHIQSEYHLVATSLTRKQLVGQTTEDGKEVPYMFVTRYYILNVTPDQVKHMNEDALYDVMWERSDVQAVLFCHDEETVRLATSEEQELLNVPSGTPVLSILEIVRDVDKNILAIHDIVLRPHVKVVYEYNFRNQAE